MAPRTKSIRLAVVAVAGLTVAGAGLIHHRDSYDPAKQVVAHVGFLAGSRACPYIIDKAYKYEVRLGKGLVARERNGRLVIVQGQQVLAGAGDKVKGTSRPGDYSHQLVTDCLGQRSYRFTVSSLVKWDGR